MTERFTGPRGGKKRAFRRKMSLKWGRLGGFKNSERLMRASEKPHLIERGRGIRNLNGKEN